MVWISNTNTSNNFPILYKEKNVNILFISKAGDSLSLCERVQREGHNSFFYIFEKQASKVGDRIIQRTKTKSPLMTEETHKCQKGNVLQLLRETQPDLAVFDMVEMGEVADYVASQKVPVFGASKWADFAELNREYGYKLMKSAGIKTPPTDTFTPKEVDKAIALVEKTKKRYVYKPSGNISCAHTYVSRGSEDMIAMLEMWREDHEDFELQEYVEGVEVSCEIWWNGISSHLHNWTMEEKKFMNNDIGPMIGCAGNVVSFIKSNVKLVKEGVGKMEKLLKKTNYRGPIDLNSICTKDGLYGLEFTVRLGYDAIQSLLELYRGSLTQLLYNTATGGDKHGECYGGMAIGVRLTVPPYPNIQKEIVGGIPIIGVNSNNLKHIWWSDVCSGKDYYESAGYDGNLGCVTARGEDVRECRRRVYRTISNLTIPQLQYRTDIGERVVNDIKRLKEWGYL